MDKYSIQQSIEITDAFQNKRLFDFGWISGKQIWRQVGIKMC